MNLPSAMTARPLRLLLIFVSIFFALQMSWERCRATAIESWLIDDATVRPAAWLVSALWPDNPALANKNSLISAHGRLNILNGCEGLETLFLLIAAFLTYPLNWKLRGIGIATSAALIYVLNQGRIAILWWSVHYQPNLFGLLHGTVLPLVLIAIALLFFLRLLPQRNDA